MNIFHMNIVPSSFTFTMFLVTEKKSYHTPLVLDFRLSPHLLLITYPSPHNIQELYTKSNISIDRFHSLAEVGTLKITSLTHSSHKIRKNLVTIFSILYYYFKNVTWNCLGRYGKYFDRTFLKVAIIYSRLGKNVKVKLWKALLFSSRPVHSRKLYWNKY